MSRPCPELLGAISQQPNMNQGGNPDLSRYAIWLLPLALPWLLDADASRAKRADSVDKMAAAYILQGALDRLRVA